MFCYFYHYYYHCMLSLWPTQELFHSILWFQIIFFLLFLNEKEASESGSARPHKQSNCLAPRRQDSCKKGLLLMQLNCEHQSIDWGHKHARTHIPTADNVLKNNNSRVYRLLNHAATQHTVRMIFHQLWKTDTGKYWVSQWRNDWLTKTDKDR